MQVRPVQGTIRFTIAGHLADVQRYHSAAERGRIIRDWQAKLPAGFRDKAHYQIAPDLTTDLLRECLYVLNHYGVDREPARVAFRLGLPAELLTKKIEAWRAAGMHIITPREMPKALCNRAYGQLRSRASAFKAKNY